ncbi:MAG TPA: hypothetical protein VH415_05935 [Nitrososphaeraceae archaeon]
MIPSYAHLDLDFHDYNETSDFDTLAAYYCNPKYKITMKNYWGWAVKDKRYKPLCSKTFDTSSGFSINWQVSHKSVFFQVFGFTQILGY